MIANLYAFPLVRFLAVGVSNLLVTYTVYLFALAFMDYRSAFAICFIAGLIYTSVLTIRHTFLENLTMVRVVVYGAYYLGYFFINIGLIGLMVEDYAVSARYAPLFLLVLLTPAHFLLSKALIAGFRRFGGDGSLRIR